MLGRFAFVILFLLPASLRAEWHEASSDNFLVVADQSERDVRAFAERLERYHAALMSVLNQPNQKPSPSNRVTIYVVKSGADVRKLAGDKSGFLQGFYQPRAGGSLAFISRVESGGREVDDSERILFHEYAHHVMHSTNEWSTPRWLSEGFAEFYSTVRFERDGGVSVGLPANHRGYELALARNVGIEALLDAATYDKTKTKAYDEFYGRSWALYHYLLVSQKRPGQLVNYMVALANGASELDAARTAFGDLKQLEKELDSYIRQSRWSYIPIAASKISIGPINSRKMRPAEAAIMPVVLVGSALGIFAYVTGNAVYSKYLIFPHIPGAGELLIFCGALAGAGLAFLWFNANPAQVFMGDVGALALGGALGTIAVITRQEIVLAIMGGIFVAEALSVIIQVGWFKYTRRRYGEGRRIFLMAPLHHHFEKKGWAETQVVVRFWIITMLLCLIGLASLKLR